MVDIELLAPTAADDRSLVEALVALVNTAYATAEEGMWRPGLTRTDLDDTITSIGQHQVAVANVEQRIVGSVRAKLLDASTGWFGALAVEVGRGGDGIGRALVDWAEAHVGGLGASTMQLELLVPSQPHPHSDRLASWYDALGYRTFDTRPLDEVDPPAVAHVLSPCTVAIMRKAL